MSRRLRVSAAVILDTQYVLIAQRHSDDQMGDKWEFPGGKIEAGESPEVCLQRELYEELELRVEVHEQMVVIQHRYPEFEIELMAYRCTIRSGELSLQVHQDCRWAALDELENFDFSDADKPIVAMLQKKPAVPDSCGVDPVFSPLHIKMEVEKTCANAGIPKRDEHH